MLLPLAVAWADPVEDALATAAPLRSLRALDPAPVIPADAWGRAAAGEVVTGQAPGDPVRQVWGVAVLAVPIDRLWGAINDDRAKPRWTDLAYVEVLRGAPCGATRTTFQYLDVSMLQDRWWVVEQRANTALAERSGGRVRELVWAAVPGGEALLTEAARGWAAKGVQVTETTGAWLLVDTGDGRTLVEYVAASDPGGAVPGSVAARFAASGIPGTFDAMRRLAEAGPACP